MVTFVRNLTGVKKFRPPKLSAFGNSPAPGSATVEAIDRGSRIPTRELKVLIGVLDSFLSCPVQSKTAAPKVRRAMAGRLAFLTKELAKRDAKDNRPLSADALASKLTAASSASTGMRVSVKKPQARTPIDFSRGFMM